MTHETTVQSDIYARITNKIVADLEQGQLTWRKPWNAEHLGGNVNRPLRWNDEPYTGINTLVLWAAAAEKGYAHPHWMTFKQATDMKANVRKSEKGAQVVYANKLTKEEEGQDGEVKTRGIPFLKCYTVFNVSQIEGLPEAFYQLPEPKVTNPETRNAELEQFLPRRRPTSIQGPKRLTRSAPTAFRCRRLRASRPRPATMPRWPTN
ncbi:MAG: ArdC-like ssDNA-binding domain-containing protein [Hymenobacter sp.]